MPFRNKSNTLQAAIAASRNSSNTSNNSRRANGDYSSANSTPHSTPHSTPQSATKINPLAQSHQSNSSLAKSNGLSQPSQTSISSSAFSIPPDINDQIIQKLVNPNSKLNLEALIDAVTALYHDTNISALKKDGKIAKFITSYETTIKNAIRERTKLADFDEIRLLGQGAFGEVKLVRHKPTKKVFAMKTLNKKYMVRKWLAESSANFMEERQILMNGAYCPWVIQLHYAFQDQRNLYMVMEFMAGGDLVKLVERFELPDNWVRFYAMEIILGIEAIHNMGYLHRDIKPDNILLDRTGHVKLADFGTCLKMDARKQVKFQRAVGTPDYVPPEMLSAEGRMESYGSESDWWSFGIVLYELIVGDVPFYSETLTGTYSKILHHQENLEFPEEVPITNNARAFILTLITDKRERNGRNCDCSGIKNHKWFTEAKDDWNWENIREHPAVVIPELTTDVDTKYFDAIEPNQDRSNYDDTFGEVTTFEGAQLPFIGFSYSTIPGYEDFAIKNQQDLMGSKSRSVSNGSSLNLTNRPLVPPKPEIDAGEVVKLKEHVKEHQKALQNERSQTVNLKSQMAAQKREHEIQLKSMENQWKRNTRTLTMQSGINDNEGFQALKQELSEISEKLVKAEAEKRKEAERAAILQRDRDAEQTAKQGLENQLQKTKQNIQQLNRKLEDNETLLVERSEKYKVAERQLRAAEQNIHTLKTQLVEEHGNRVRVRENMDTELKTQADELNLLKIEVQNSEKTKQKKEDEKKTLEHQIEELRKVNANIQVEQRRSQNASVNELERKLTETIRALSLKKSELDMATRKFEDQQNDFLRKVREIEELKRQRTRDENKVRELQVSITEKEQKIAQLATDFDQKQQEFNGLKKDNADMVEQLQNSKKQLREQQSQMRELTDQLDAEHYFLTLYKSQIRDLESDKAEWERQKGDLEAELHSVKEESAKINANKENVMTIENDAKYKDLLSRNDQLASDLELRRSATADLDQKYQNTVSKVEQLMAEKNTLQQEITNIKQECESSSEKLDHERSEWAAKLRQEQLMKTQAINKLTEIVSKRNDADSHSLATPANRGVKERNNRKKDKELQALHKEYYTLQAEFDKARFDHDRKMDELKLQMDGERAQWRGLVLDQAKSDGSIQTTPPSKRETSYEHLNQLQYNGNSYDDPVPRTPTSSNNPHFVVTGAQQQLPNNANNNSSTVLTSPHSAHTPNSQNQTCPPPMQQAPVSPSQASQHGLLFNDAPISGWLSVPKIRGGKEVGWANMLLRRGKPAWKPQFVKVDRKNINFYDSEKDPSDKPASYVELENLYHVRGVTQADIPRSPAADIPKIFQIIYSPSEEINSHSNKKVEPRMQFLLAKNAQEQALWVQRLSKKVPKAMSRTPNAPSVNPERTTSGLSSGQSASYAQIPGMSGPSTPTSFASSTNIIRSHSPNNHPGNIGIQRAHSSASYGNHYQPSSANLNYSHSTQSPNRADHLQQNRQQIDQRQQNDPRHQNDPRQQNESRQQIEARQQNDQIPRNNRLAPPDRQYH